MIPRVSYVISSLLITEDDQDGMRLPAIGEDKNGDATDQDFCRSITDECDHLESDIPVHPEPLYEDSDSDCSEYEYESVPLVEILNRYCLKVKEEAMVSAKTMESIREVTISLMKAQTSQCQRHVHKVLEKHGVDPSSMPELEDAFTPLQWIHDSPELNDRNFMKTKFPKMTPREIVLGKRRQWKRLANKKSRILEVPERFYYVSLLASIEAQLRNRRILDMVAERDTNKQQNGLLCDFNDGSLMTEHELFSCDPQSLKIILYYDDFEVTNERTRRKHKLAMFYYQLANLYSEYRSKLKSIHLVAVVEQKYLKKYGVHRILQPFVEELQILGGDLGHHFDIHGGTICLRGALLAVVADTPASNLLGGYKESVGGAKRKCRHCMADFNAIQSLFTEEQFDLRNEELHEYHLRQMQENPSLHQHYSKEYGVVARSALMDAPYFNVTQQMPLDIMHVILEGALSRALYFVLKWFLDNSIFTFDELNHFVQNFNYGYSEMKDKPVKIEVDDLKSPFSNLGQTAVQIWLLSRIFTFFAAPFSDMFPDVWRVLQTILEITAICCSKKISINILGYLKCLVQEHLQLFKSCIDANVTPKQHYLVHLCSQILTFGPPIRSWAMRFEAKHQQFKHIPKVTKNFKNLPKTLSERHQCGVCADNIALSAAQESSDHPLFRGEFKPGSGSMYTRLINGEKFNEARGCIQRFYPSFDVEETSHGLFQANSVIIHGTCYKVDKNTILLAEMRNSNPVFGAVANIWLHERLAFFALKLFATVNFTAVLGSYEIEEEQLPSGLFVVEASDLLMTTVMHIYKYEGAMFICPREDPNALFE